jgi:hypothetical protein
MVKKTNAIGIFAKTGRYGGTYSHMVVSQKVCKAESYSEILEPFRAQ